jgi:wobble nucleotide-excising tRNase
LFIVSSLIRDVLKEVREGEGQIKQVFVLTHNVYFHKEVTFVPRKRKRNLAKTGESFWTVRKIGTESLIENHKTNPVKTSYEMLWDEVRNPNRSTLTIQNTLRRIIENYFKILGGIDTDELSNQFEGNEKLICGSLISWMHDGSHNAFEDAAVTVDTSAVEKYLQVFRAIFERTNHKAHYEMMMRTPPSMASTAAALVEAAHA